MPFLAAKGFNTNLVHFIPSYHVIISNVHVCSFMDLISQVHENYNLWRPVIFALNYKVVFLLQCCICIFEPTVHYLSKEFLSDFRVALLKGII